MTTPSDRPHEIVGITGTGKNDQNYLKAIKQSLGSKQPKGPKKRDPTKAEPLSVNVSMVGVSEQNSP